MTTGNSRETSQAPENKPGFDEAFRIGRLRKYRAGSKLAAKRKQAAMRQRLRAMATKARKSPR